MMEFPDNIFFERNQWHVLVMRAFSKLRGNKHDIEYIQRRVVNREIKNVYKNGQQDATKNIRAVYEKYKDRTYDESEEELVFDEWKELWQAIKVDLREK